MNYHLISFHVRPHQKSRAWSFFEFASYLAFREFCYVRLSGTQNGITDSDAIVTLIKVGLSGTTTAQFRGETQGREPANRLLIVLINFLSCVSPTYCYRQLNYSIETDMPCDTQLGNAFFLNLPWSLTIESPTYSDANMRLTMNASASIFNYASDAVWP